ncbi:Choline transport protein [Rasamsonia emersonii CBS 393.64]|uniref:Choline transport protein n=1 Tax=Rasamsonia emersonii (strain ATCC 16479 / CBS 393.64 / IMI 116815) TaxID=1408163 RepID=A0A0F4YR24_RASE3|nr:Choline transport protein [Rasamsonia emersonii CBS 393.64]KKA20291.1 Choline transport protein [Rasamsonia emersonii CBS 393.64]
MTVELTHDSAAPVLHDVERTVVEDNDAHKLQALGHQQELRRNFSTYSIAATGFVNGNAWSAVGGSILVAIYNGGAAGVLYELIVVSLAYAFITASLAELSSSIPSSGGVYHWATVVAGPKYGRVIGFYAGWFNFLAWVFAISSTCAILGNALVQMYLVRHPEVEWKAWMVFIAFQLLNWMGCLIVYCGNRFLPVLNFIGSFAVVSGVFVSIVVLAVMPKAHASSDFVWRTFVNGTGWSNRGLIFVMGLLNGAPSPMIALSYAIADLNSILSIQSSFPLIAIYLQATGSNAGAIGLTFIVFLAYFVALPDNFIASGRTFWALSRDNATPFSSYFAHVSKRWQNPVRANMFCALVTTAVGCIYVGNTTAFNAFVGSFVVLTTISYGITIAAHLATGWKFVLPGPFHLGRWGWGINLLALGYIVVSDVIFCFPFVQPVDAANMNYVSVIVGGFTTFVTVWWFLRARQNYEGPIIEGQDQEESSTPLSESKEESGADKS